MAQVESIPYDVIRVDRFSNGLIHGRDAYEGMARGDIDREPMLEVAAINRVVTLPPVQVVHPSDPPPVQEIVVAPQVALVLRGEDKVFDQVRLDEEIQRCVFQGICTDEVKAIPGVYLGDEHIGDADWQGGADEFEVITESQSRPGYELPKPGRTFMDVPADVELKSQPEPEVELIQLPDPG
jgi:hypothetical protein